MIVTDTGAPIAPGIGLAAGQWVDPFNRPDGLLGNGWIEGHAWDDQAYEPLGLLDGAVVCTNPRTRTGTYLVDQNTDPGPGELWQGIGCAWRETGTTSIRVSTVWSGIWDEPTHTENGPLLHVTPGTTEHGFGCWIGYVSATVAAVVVGTIGAPCEAFDAMAGTFLPPPTPDGTPWTIEQESDGTDIATYINGQLITMTLGITGDSCPVPAALVGSTLHGFCVDTHLTTEAAIPTTPVCRAVAFL